MHNVMRKIHFTSNVISIFAAKSADGIFYFKELLSQDDFQCTDNGYIFPITITEAKIVFEDNSVTS